MKVVTDEGVIEAKKVNPVKVGPNQYKIKITPYHGDPVIIGPDSTTASGTMVNIRELING